MSELHAEASSSLARLTARTIALDCALVLEDLPLVNEALVGRGDAAGLCESLLHLQDGLPGLHLALYALPARRGLDDHANRRHAAVLRLRVQEAARGAA